MVTFKEQARQYVTEAKIRIMDLPSFESKVDTINTLLDLEWNLQESEVEEQEDDIWDDELRGGIESPWGD